MFHSEFSESPVIIPCYTTIIYEYCDQNLVPADILDDEENYDKQEDFDFSSSFSRKTLELYIILQKYNQRS